MRCKRRRQRSLYLESRARLLGHPVHQQLVAFPLGLLATALLFDLVYLVGGNGTMAFVSYCPSSVGLLHGVGNLMVLGLFLGSWLLRHGGPQEPPAAAFVLSFASGALALVTAWLGGELVSRLGVGVSDQAGLNAESSLHDTGPGHDAAGVRGR